MSDYGDNVWEELEDMGDGVSGRRLRRTDDARLVAAVWELAPGSDGVVFHFHHGIEELLVVLRGRPVLRAATGERQLDEARSCISHRGRRARTSCQTRRTSRSAT